MKLRPYFLRKEQAFTLAEVLIASVISGVMLTAVVVGGASFQKMFAASDFSLKASADQSRIMDYVARDVRRALTVTVSNSGQMLTLTMPDYIDSSTGLPRIPTIKPGTSSYGIPKGVVDYGSSASPITITYFPANAPTGSPATYSFAANGQNFIRQSGTAQTVISMDCTSLQINFTDQTASVMTSASFAPRYTFFTSGTNARTATTVYAGITLRNTRRN